MPPTNVPQPTGVELEILRVIWRLGSGTVRQVHQALATGRRTTGYSTTLKMMQVMRDKGLLLRDDSVRPQVYRPRATQERTQLQLLDDLIHKAFGGSAGRLLVRALSTRRVSPEELAEIKKLIRQAEPEGK
jgi:BlaI family transcriptional regulator, penicillinase repressor